MDAVWPDEGERGSIAGDLTRRGFLGAAVLLGSGLLGLPIEPGTRAARRKAGVNLHGGDEPTLLWMRTLGITRVRNSFQLNVWLDHRDLDGDGVPDTVTYTNRVYAEIRRCRAAGLDVVVTATTPQVGVAIDEPNGQAAFIRMMKQLATDHASSAYGARVVWQIMNEWDAEPFFGHWFTSQPTLHERGAAYGRFLAAVYDAVKAVDPAAIVITGGIASRPSAEQVQVFKGLASTAAGKFDGVSFHFYGTLADFAIASKEMRAAVGPTLPIFVTEWGPGEGITDPQAQAAFIGSVLDHIDQHPTEITEHYIYVWRGGPRGYAICNDDNTLRPAALLLEGRTAK